MCDFEYHVLANGCDVSVPLRLALRKVVYTSNRRVVIGWFTGETVVGEPVSINYVPEPLETRRHLSLLLLWVLGADVSSDFSVRTYFYYSNNCLNS
nr:unnamed protein product [Callosobruchus chinensis]